MTAAIKIAIIGAGPRGLALAEHLRSRNNDREIDIHLYDPLSTFGAGPNFDPNESDLSLLNLPAFAVDIPDQVGGDERGFLAFNNDNGGSADDYPPRSTLGKWLEGRFSKIRASVEPFTSKVTGIERSDEGWIVTTDNGKSQSYTHVVISVAQAESAPDRAVARWQGHAERSKAELKPVYPSIALGKAASKSKGKTVAIRGFGLSCLDALRQLTVAQGGRFTEAGYQPSGNEANAIYIFSKDGLSLHPKPDGQDYDSRFDVSDEEVATFEGAARTALSSQPKDALGVLLSALHTPATRILESFDAAPRSEAINAWLHAEEKQAGSQHVASLMDTLEQSHGMALGTITPDVGYVLGQVWRKFQDHFSNIFDQTEDIADDTRKILVSFDEGMKRYSYGPPVETFAELRSLIDAGLVKLELLNNPTVSMTDNGWKLKLGEHEAEVEVMVDAVLPDTSLASVTDSAVTGLREKGLITANAVGGAKVSPRGELLDDHGKPVDGLYLIGRLANGSVIGADSIHHCFGATTQRVAEAILESASKPSEDQN